MCREGDSMPDVLAHNERAAATWGAGGREYDQVSEYISDALAHIVNRIVPKPGERILDVATGTGYTARLLASRGASVTGVDIGHGVIEAAKALSPSIDFRVADAEALPFGDASFDAVVSTFGVMFVANPKVAAQELARVCKSGGRLGLVNWVPEGTVAGLFGIMRPYLPPPSASPPPSPFEWGRPERIRELLGDAFDLKFEMGTTTLRMPDGGAIWDMFLAGFGPTKALAASLDGARREQLRHDFIAYHERYLTDLGVTMPRDYLIALGRRK
jgi:SAM-dependent methyltransferase